MYFFIEVFVGPLTGFQSLKQYHMLWSPSLSSKGSVNKSHLKSEETIFIIVAIAVAAKVWLTPPWGIFRQEIQLISPSQLLFHESRHGGD